MLLEETVGQELHLLKDKVENNAKENLTFCSLCYANTILSKDFDEEFLEKAGPMTLFDVNQPVSYQKFKILIESTCETLKEQANTYEECNIDQEYAHSSVAKCFLRLRSHEKETFIKKSEFLDVHDASTYTMVMQTFFSNKKKNSASDSYVSEFLGSVQFLGCNDVWRDIKKLEETTVQLQKMITQDPRLADPFNSKVVEVLVQILKNVDNAFIQSQVVNILSRGRYYDRKDVIIQQALPVLVKLIRCKHIVVEAVFTLTRLARASSDHVDIIVDCDALEAALDVVTETAPGEVLILDKVAMFLAVVCRANNLSSDKVNVAITLARNLLKIKAYPIYTLHIARTCYALSYLTYGRCVELIEETLCESLVKLLTHDETSVIFSALGVVGNIVRWGNYKQIQYLTKNCQLLMRLGKSVLCSKLKKFRKEACQIISNIAARSETWIKDRDEAGLTEPLFKMLKMDEYDVRVEAAWAIFNGVCAYEFEQLDKYSKST